MHELSIAMSIIEMAEEEAAQRGGPAVRAVHLKIGRLSGVVGSALASAFELAREDTLLATAELEIEDVPVTIRCPTCRRVRPVESIQNLRCVACGTLSSDITGGRELQVVALELAEMEMLP